MVSIPLFVLLLATYAYSVPIVQNGEVTSSKSIVMNLVDDGETTQLPNVRKGLQVTTAGSVLSNERVPREMIASAPVELSARGIEESSTLFPTTVQTSSQSVVRPPREMLNALAPPPPALSEMQLRGIEESSTLFPTTVQTSSQVLDPRPPRRLMRRPWLSEMQLRGIEESSTLFPSTIETSTQFNQRVVRGPNVQSGLDLQTTEVPSSSVSSFATTTGLLRPQRGEQTEGQESTSMTMDEATTELLSTVGSNTVIEVIPGKNTKTEIIPGRNTKTEIIPGTNTKTEIISGTNTKTEIITRVPGRLAVGKPELSQGQN